MHVKFSELTDKEHDLAQEHADRSHLGNGAEFYSDGCEGEEPGHWFMETSDPEVASSIALILTWKSL